MTARTFLWALAVSLAFWFALALVIVQIANAAVIEGTSGPDKRIGTPRADQMFGYGGKDELRGRGGDDLLVGGRDADYLRGGPGNDDLRGGRGSDFIWAEDGEVDIVNCGRGNDFAVIDLNDKVNANCESVGGTSP